MKRKQRDTLARSAMKLLCTLLGLILAVMLIGSIAFQHLLSSINTTSTAQTTSDDILTAFSQIDLSRLSMNSAERKTVNILLIGQDRREGETQARSDSMILCTFHKETHQLTMTSFLRDLYVPIPEHGSNRINAAYSLGGMSLLRKTIEENFAVQIDGCVEVDFVQFADIIDLLGGVEIALRQDEAEVINQETGSSLTEGTHTLSGTQALAYSRIRSLDLDGDFSRTSRQRQVMRALVESYRQASLSQIIPLVGEVLPMITTDLTSRQILLLALELMPGLSDAQIVSQRIPADGTFTDQTINGMQVLVADLEASRKLLQDTMQGS